MVVGEGQPFIAALITLDPDALGPWATLHRKPGNTVADLRDDPDLHAEIQAAVDDANSAVSKAESIRAWRLLDEVFTEASGHPTPTQKLKRSVIAKDHAKRIAALYGSGRKSRSARWFRPTGLATPSTWTYARTGHEIESPCGPRIGCRTRSELLGLGRGHRLISDVPAREVSGAVRHRAQIHHVAGEFDLRHLRGHLGETRPSVSVPVAGLAGSTGRSSRRRHSRPGRPR